VLGLVCGLLTPPRPVDAQGGGVVVSVFVRDQSTGEAVPDAEISVPRANLQSRSDSLGRALFPNIPRESLLLTVRRIGYEPLTVPIRSATTDTVSVVLLLKPMPQPLLPIVVIDSASTSRFDEFAYRRRTRFGRFITGQEIRAAHGSSLSDLFLAKIPGVRILDNPGGSAIAYSLRGPMSLHGGLCQVSVYLDGLRVSDGSANVVPVELLDGVEYYPPGFVPVEYRTSGSPRGEGGSPACGVLLLWTIH